MIIDYCLMAMRCRLRLAANGFGLGEVAEPEAK
jgi:hypothetical protein